MRYILFAVLCIIALAIIIIFAALWCTTTIRIRLKNNKGSVDIKCLFFKYSIKLPAEKKERQTNGEKKAKKKGSYIELLKECKDIIYELLGHLNGRIKAFLSVNLTFGTGDPAKTGILYGWMWNIIGVLYPVVSRYINLEFPDFDIRPDFYNKCFDMNLESIIKVRCAHIINALIVVGFKNREYLKKLKANL